MLGLIFIAVWMTFVAGYLIWQQVSGDLAGEALGYQPSSISVECHAEAPVARREHDDVRRSLVYRATGFPAPGRSMGLKADS